MREGFSSQPVYFQPAAVSKLDTVAGRASHSEIGICRLTRGSDYDLILLIKLQGGVHSVIVVLTRRKRQQGEQGKTEPRE